MTTNPCARCAAPDGAHQPWCLLQQVIDRFLTPATPALDLETVTAIATKAAREAAREAVAEVLASSPARHLEAVPEPTPTPTEQLKDKLAETVERRQTAAPDRATEIANTRAAIDLFMAEMVTADGANPRAYVTMPQVMAAYEDWRPGIEAPAASKRLMAEGLLRAGHTNRRQARSSDGDAFRPAGSARPVMYFGIRLRAPKAVVPPPEPAAEDSPAWMLSDTEGKRGDHANGYIGQWPGREIPNDFRNKIVLPILRSGKGWVYKKANANGSGKPRLISPDGRVFTLPNTPSDWRAVRNTTASLRKLGLAEVI